MTRGLPGVLIGPRQDRAMRATIRLLLTLGAIATPRGQITAIQMPGSEAVQEFPTAMVEEENRLRLASVDRRLGPALPE